MGTYVKCMSQKFQKTVRYMSENYQLQKKVIKKSEMCQISVRSQSYAKIYQILFEKSQNVSEIHMCQKSVIDLLKSVRNIITD